MCEVWVNYLEGDNTNFYEYTYEDGRTLCIKNMPI